MTRTHHAQQSRPNPWGRASALYLMFWGALSIHPSFADSGDASPAGDCGRSPEVVPQFTLEDVNPNSATYGQDISSDDIRGQFMVVYWAVAT